MRIEPCPPALYGMDVGISVRDADRALAFYRDFLGLEYLMKVQPPDGAPGAGNTYHHLAFGPNRIKIISRADGALGYTMCALGISNLDEVYSACEDAGYEIPMPKSQLLAKPGRKFMTRDPEGNVIEFIQPEE